MFSPYKCPLPRWFVVVSCLVFNVFNQESIFCLFKISVDTGRLLKFDYNFLVNLSECFTICIVSEMDILRWFIYSIYLKV